MNDQIYAKISSFFKKKKDNIMQSKKKITIYSEQ